MRSVLWPHIGLLYLLAGFAGSVSAQSPPSESPTTGVAMTNISGYSFEGKRMPSWKGGAFLAIDDSNASSATVRVYGKDGAQIGLFDFAVPGGRLQNVYDAARAPDGTIVVQGSALSDDSRAAAFLAWIGPDGRTRQIVRASPFVVVDMIITEDGVLWTAGREPRDANLSEKDPNHAIIRRFSKDGVLISSYLPKSTVSYDHKRYSHPVVGSQLITSGDRVGWYSPAAHEYVEWSLDGAMTSRSPTLDLPPGMRVSGAGLCSDGTLYVSAISSGQTKPRDQFVYELDRRTASWTPVNLNVLPKSNWGIKIFACEGSSLVTMTRHPAELIWVRPK